MSIITIRCIKYIEGHEIDLMENDINGCNISVVACLVRHVILVSLKHHCHHKGVENYILRFK